MSKNPIEQRILDELKKLDGRAVACRYTPNGEVLVAQVDGAHVDLPLEVVELEPLPEGFGAGHRDVMETVFSAVSQITEKFPDREVPLTRKEVLGFGVDQKTLDELEVFNLLKHRIIKLVPKTKRRQRSGTARRVYYFTAQGRAYVRKEFDPSYALQTSDLRPELGSGLPQ